MPCRAEDRIRVGRCWRCLSGKPLGGYPGTYRDVTNGLAGCAGCMAEHQVFRCDTFFISEPLSDFLVQVPPLLDDIRAWRLFQAWAYGHANPTLVTDAMEVVFGERYVREEWEETIVSMHEVWEDEDEESLPRTRGVFQEILGRRGLSLPPPQRRRYLLLVDVLPLGQDNDHYTWTPVSPKKRRNGKPGQSSTGDSDMRLLDLGVIDLTASVESDDRAKVGSSEVSQMQKESDGDDSTKAALKVSRKRKRADALQRTSAKAGPSKMTQKRRRTDVQRNNPFLDLHASEDGGEDDDNDNDEIGDGDTPMGGRLQVSEVLPAGRAAFASHVDDICRHYESGCSDAGQGDSRGLRTSPIPSASPPIRVYKVNVMTGM